MKIRQFWKCRSNRFKDSVSWAIAFVAILSSFFTISGISLGTIGISATWWFKLVILVVLLLLMIVAVYLIKGAATKKGIFLDIRGISVHITEGNLFNESGMKIIPFNEHFDTLVDENIISSNTINGNFINKYVSDVNILNEQIKENAKKRGLNKDSVLGKYSFPLGSIIKTETFLLLSFSRFDKNNNAHISLPEYEKCMLNMWKEVRDNYNNLSISLPLIGSGITSFDGIPRKSNFELLRCILCTLNASGENINQPIRIILQKSIIKEIDLYELKAITDSWE